MKKRSWLFIAVGTLLAFAGLIGSPLFAQDANDSETNKALVLALIEADNARDYDRMDDLLAEDVVRHSAATSISMPEISVVSNREEYKRFLQASAEAFPDYRSTVLMVAAEGEYVAYYSTFSGTFAANGNKVEAPIVGFVRIEDGKIAEAWVEWDNVSWGAQMQQGAPPPVIGTYEPPASGDFDLEANRALALAWAEALDERAYDRLDAIVADDFVLRSSAMPDAQITSREAMIGMLKATDEAYPDNKYAIQMMAAEGDLVAGYNLFSGTDAATGKQFEVPLVWFFRVEDGKLAELWVEWDTLTVLAQLGLLPPPESE